MAPASIRYRGVVKARPRFELYDGSELTTDLGFMLVLPKKQAGPIGLTPLRNAMRSAATPQTNSLYFALEPGDVSIGFDSGYRNDVRLDLSDDKQGILVVLGINWLEVEPPDAQWHANLLKVVAPLLKRHRCSELSFDPDPAVNGESIVARFAVPIRNRTVGDALGIGDQAWALIQALDGGRLTLQSTVGLLQSGFATCLEDQEEGPWLEAKRAPYRLDEDAQKYELAKDVAAFANSDEGGVIVIGARTRTVNGSDVVHKITDVPLELVKRDSYRKIISDRVHPQVENLDVRTVGRVNGHGIAYIHVPQQRRELQPFLVKGALVDGKISTRFVSLPKRVGEDTAHAPIAEIHSLLQAGRVALRAR
jgi:Putative DNA-binding domain